ncbi:MAG: ATP-binding protein [Prevotella sp.]|nr:ATP-binding protein [Prevotella sp.]
MLNYPIGVQDFATIRKGGYVYVDKTDLVYKLTRGHIYFLGRPRRFGKSLLVSTLKYYFEGRRDLFEGLKIANLAQEWQQHPVFVFDFNLGNKKKSGGLEEYLLSVISKGEQDYGIPPLMKSDGSAPLLDAPMRFAHLVEAVHEKTGLQAVVLVDEYDKPLLDLLETGNPADEAQLEANRDTLRNFFSTFKAADAHLRFVFLTGITKFSQVSMFSGVNQPDDISYSNRFDTLLGITEEELYTVFAGPIEELADEQGLSVEDTKAWLKQMYDGYHFSQKLKDVYNPFSLLNVFADLKIKDYWFTTGTPSYLMRLLSKCTEDVMQYTGQWYDEKTFIDYKAATAMPLPIIFQSGYLTIKAFDRQFNTYLLDYPNREVREGLLTLLAGNYLQPTEDTKSWLVKMVKALEAADLDLVRRLFTGFLAATPYSMRPKKDEKDRELYFHYTFYLLMRLISCYTVYTEKQLSEGRADCIIETPKQVYIFEFKLDGTAADAMQQIKNRGYARAYDADPRRRFLLGVSFSSKTGTTEDWLVEEMAVGSK